MNTSKSKKRGFAAIFSLSPAAHLFTLAGAVLTALFHLLKGKKALMQPLSAHVVRPLHRALALATAGIPFSLGEILYALFLGGILVYIIIEIALLVSRPARLRRAYRMFVRLTASALCAYALFCLLWGVYYYGDDFSARNGFQNTPVSKEELVLTTRYFADRLSLYGTQVPRDAEGFYRADRAEILARTPQLFRAIEKRYPSLAGPEVPVKGMVFSRVMSIMGYTGFFCPFTAEASINTDFPVGLFAATAAHELSHQRGVAKEEEANFTAVLAALESGDPDYCYSACMLAYIHLSNALYSVDPAAQSTVSASLSTGVKADLQLSNDYWAQFDTPVREVTDTLYEGFLQSYGQPLGLRSYGACVDLLVNYYAAQAGTHFAR